MVSSNGSCSQIQVKLVKESSNSCATQEEEMLAIVMLRRKREEKGTFCAILFFRDYQAQCNRDKSLTFFLILELGYRARDHFFQGHEKDILMGYQATCMDTNILLFPTLLLLPSIPVLLSIIRWKYIFLIFIKLQISEQLCIFKTVLVSLHTWNPLRSLLQYAMESMLFGVDNLEDRPGLIK